METKLLDVSKVKHNTGQIEGLPSNPRTIKDESFEALKKSITDDPEMMELREIIVFPLKGLYIVIGGNKRFSACKDLKHKQVPCKILPKNTTVEKLKAITIKDNVSAGEWDFDALRADWDDAQLKEWGLDVPEIAEPGDMEDLSDSIKGEYRIEVTCKSESDQEKIYNKLIEMGLDCRLLTL